MSNRDYFDLTYGQIEALILDELADHLDKLDQKNKRRLQVEDGEVPNDLVS